MGDQGRERQAPFVQCATCARYGCEPGCGCTDCGALIAAMSLERLFNLALCLRDAGALCAAWVMGRDYGESPHLMRDDEWAPNADGDSAPDFEAPCGRTAGGGGR